MVSKGWKENLQERVQIGEQGQIKGKGFVKDLENRNRGWLKMTGEQGEIKEEKQRRKGDEVIGVSMKN
ncbi:hypothetical protein SLEP1_g29576 [Rubroshorea leprosula]|uniref:Uncharacterized protein n=1 Tax=Rubroshorea leprosula TaxID=152421 RepID=A0AAV5K3U8_9ROSI|nr:hypothetical protein SLEP1_g29576 [Rubroshorea leprosula]